MENINGLLEEELARAIEKMKTMKPEDPGYKSAAEAVATLQRARMEEEKFNFEDRKNGDELMLRTMEQEQKAVEAKQEKKKFTVRACLDAAAIVVPALMYGYFGYKGFKFEETGHICSNVNKWNLGNIFKFKR